MTLTSQQPDAPADAVNSPVTHGGSENGDRDVATAAKGNQSGSESQQEGGSEEFKECEELLLLVKDLGDHRKREAALLELSRNRENLPDLALALWFSFGAAAGIFQEIVSVYPLLSPPALTSTASNRVCNALALLQCVASHPETRTGFLAAHTPLLLYPFLNTTSNTRPFEYLRLTSLGVIGAFVKADDHQAIAFLLQTEITSLCLKIMETGSELSKTVATFIMQRVLMDPAGLRYVCGSAERFLALTSVLQTMLQQLAEQPSSRLLKHILKCYLRLTDHPRAKIALRRTFPPILGGAASGWKLQGPLEAAWKEDPSAAELLVEVVQSLERSDPVLPESLQQSGTGIAEQPNTAAQLQTQLQAQLQAQCNLGILNSSDLIAAHQRQPLSGNTISAPLSIDTKQFSGNSGLGGNMTLSNFGKNTTSNSGLLPTPLQGHSLLGGGLTSFLTGLPSDGLSNLGNLGATTNVNSSLGNASDYANYHNALFAVNQRLHQQQQHQQQQQAASKLSLAGLSSGGPTALGIALNNNRMYSDPASLAAVAALQQHQQRKVAAQLGNFRAMDDHLSNNLGGLSGP